MTSGLEQLVLVPCSRRKRVPIDPILRASDLKTGSIECLALNWVARLRRARPTVRAEEFYAGRGLSEARMAAAALGARLCIVSAGLGIIESQQKVPAYSLTLAANDPDAIGRKVAGEFSAERWWSALHQALGAKQRTFSTMMSDRRGLAIVALPGTYLNLIAADIAALPSEDFARVRLVGPPRQMVPSALIAAWMPYDSRFDGPDGPIPGTRGDFAQRAARHFAEAVVLQEPNADAAAHAAMVERYLMPLAAPSLPRRESGSDAEIIGVIRSLLPRSGGRSGETLRLLRRHAGRACEQSRFRRLFAQATNLDSPA